MQNITASVGQGGKNHSADVKVVQTLLKAKGSDPGKIDGVCGAKTVAAIKKFQSTFLKNPDGLIDPGKTTWLHLSGQRVLTPVKPKPLTPIAWSGDSSQWSQEKKLQSMKPELAAKVRAIVASLGQRGFQPKVFYGWRSIEVQARLFAEGKSKVRFSFHNGQKLDGTPNSYAADIVDSRYGWSSQAQSSGFWTALGEEARKRGMVWGGDWAGFRDWAHVQLVQNGELARVKAESGL